jgi:hypothetical protein
VGESNYLQVKAILGELFHLHLSLPGGIFASSGQQLTRKSSVEWPQLALPDRQLSSYRGLIFIFFKFLICVGGKERVVLPTSCFFCDVVAKMAMIHRRIRPNFGYKLNMKLILLLFFKTYILG